MTEIEFFFDINRVLNTVYTSLERVREKRGIELIYEMDKTIPKDLKGEAVLLIQLLTRMLTFVFENTDKKEITLLLDAPKDFLYEEFISFKIKETNIAKEKLQDFLKTELSKDLEIFDGKIVYSSEDNSDIQLNILFKINELGHRRHYRLPDTTMLNKKALLICVSDTLARSIKKMFKYFLYDIDVGIDEYKKQGSNLTQYDILLIDNKLTTDGFENLVAKTQKKTALKYVLLQDTNYKEIKNKSIVSAHLIKPVMQESIFELVILLFQNDSKEIKPEKKKNIIDIKKDNNEKGSNEKKKVIVALPLDTELGEQNAKEMGVSYAKELRVFLDMFDHSDIYFRQAVNEKSEWKIKEFCINLEKQTKIIGAQSMLNFAHSVSLLFVYDKLDMLPSYSGKFHVELQKLTKEINTYLTFFKR